MRLGRRKPRRHCTPVCRQLAFHPRQGVNFVLDKFAKRGLLCGEVSVRFRREQSRLAEGRRAVRVRLDKGIVLGVNDFAGRRGAQHLAGRGGRPRHGQPRLAGGDSCPLPVRGGRRSLGASQVALTVWQTRSLGPAWQAFGLGPLSFKLRCLFCTSIQATNN